MVAKTIRRALTALVLTLVAVSFAFSSGVLARYISTTDAESNVARVAAWGFDISVDATELFGSGSGGVDLDLDPGSIDLDAEEGLDALAPGASGSMKISISGTSEVYARLTVNVSGSDVFLKKGDEVYYPIVWTLKKGTDVLAGGSLTDVNAYFSDNTLTSDVNELEIPPGTHSAFEGDYVLSWSWEFNNADSGISGLSVNDADTLLGFAAIPVEKRTAEQTAALAAYIAATKVSMSVSVVIEQIQK